SDRYRELYAVLGVPGTLLLPGARDAVAAVHRVGGRSIVVTAKYEPNAHLCLAHVGLEVDAVVGSLHGAEKADALTGHGAAIYVAAPPPDAHGPRTAGAVAVGVTTRPHDRAELLDAGADVVLESLSQFRRWFQPWFQAWSDAGRRDAGAVSGPPDGR